MVEAKKDRYDEGAHMFRQGGAGVAAEKPVKKIPRTRKG